MQKIRFRDILGTHFPVQILPMKFSPFGNQFKKDGFLVLPRFYSEDTVDRVLGDIESHLEKDRWTVVDNLRSGARSFWCLENQDRPRMFKFNDLYLDLESVRNLGIGESITPKLHACLGSEPTLINSLYFEHGSTQGAHVDTLYMTPRTPDGLCAIWVALEDVEPNAGPMFYYPGSHRIKPFRFSNGGYHTVPEEMEAWEAHVQRGVKKRKLERVEFHAKKGDVFIWHANLLHGGSPIRTPAQTRKSLVFHYYTAEDCSHLEWGPQLRHEAERAPWLNRLPQGVSGVSPDQLEAYGFPESRYLRRHTDVAQAVQSGDLVSGFDHYASYGYRESRAI